MIPSIAPGWWIPVISREPNKTRGDACAGRLALIFALVSALPLACSEFPEDLLVIAPPHYGAGTAEIRIVVGRGVDLSMHGALLVASANVTNDESIALTFPRRSPAAPEIEVCGRVVRVDTMSPGAALHRIAIRFDRELPAGQLLARVHCGSARPSAGGVP